MPKPARNSMTSYRRPDSFTHDQTESGTPWAGFRTCVVTRERMYNQVLSTHSAASTHHTLEIGAVMQSVRLR